MSLCTLAMVLFFSASLQAETDVLAQQRSWFLQAKQSLKLHHMQQLQYARERLQTYPLLPYLDLWEAEQHLKEQDPASMTALLQRYADLPEARQLRAKWLRQLRYRKQWPELLKQLRGDEQQRSLRDHYTLALWYTGKHAAAYPRLRTAWLAGELMTSTLFQAPLRDWKKHQPPTVRDQWQRLRALRKHGRWQSMRLLARSMPRAERKRVEWYLAALRQPRKALRAWGADHRAESAWMLADCLKALLRQDLSLAWSESQRLSASLSRQARLALQLHMALRAAQAFRPEAESWLHTVLAEQQHDRAHAWLMRLALRQQQWKKALAVYEHMPAALQKRDRWRYWKAYSLQQLGASDAAMLLWSELAKHRGYYGFLSSNRMGSVFYQMQEDFNKLNHTALADVLRMPAIQRAREWFLLADERRASRAWRSALANAKPERLLAAAFIAHDWGWSYQAIALANRAKAHNALLLRFPLDDQAWVQEVSAKKGLSASFVFAIIRQESQFRSHAHSRVGARGLMQLMPKTAQLLAHKHHLKYSVPRLWDAKYNIQLGSWYLSDLQQRFSGVFPYVIAAYNAGPNKVDHWQQQGLSQELWIETIPYRETRRYVQQVLAFMVVYQYRLKQQPLSLMALLSEK